jgi:quercetin dioxygenase-like cupin family protein
MSMTNAAKAAQDESGGATIVVARQEDLSWFDSIEGERSAIHVNAAQSGGAFGIMESVVAPGSASPMHYHVEDEIFFIIDGLATIKIADVTYRAGPGTTILAPAGVAHAWKNATSNPLRMLATFTPGGIEKMFQHLGGKQMHEIITIAESYGTHVVGPPIV